MLCPGWGAAALVLAGCSMPLSLLLVLFCAPACVFGVSQRVPICVCVQMELQDEVARLRAELTAALSMGGGGGHVDVMSVVLGPRGATPGGAGALATGAFSWVWAAHADPLEAMLSTQVPGLPPATCPVACR